jgi:hypothetical protein
MSKHDNFVGLLGVAVGLVGIGYAMGTRSKMAKISEKLDRSIEDLASNVPIDIPSDMIERAVEKAVAVEAKQAVGKATDAAIVAVKRDIHKQVTDAVESEYSNIKGTVLEELVTEASKIDAKRVRADVERAARERALEKFDDNLDDILENFNDQLKNTSKIYTSIADSMTRYKSSDKEAVIRIG